MRGPAARVLAAVLVAALGAPAAAAEAPQGKPRTERVSTASDGAQLDRGSLNAAVSADGRYVAFATKASLFRGCEQQTYVCLAVKDRATGELTRIEGGGGLDWGPPVLSGDGRYVGHTAGTKGPSAHVYDRAAGKSTFVASAARIQAITPDGRYVLYVSGDDRFVTDRYVYVRDMVTGTAERVEGDESTTRFGAAALSADGRFVAYQEKGAGPEGDDVFVEDRTTGERVRADEGLGNSDRGFVRISGDGRRVLFVAGGRTYQYDVRGRTARQIADTPARSASGDARYVVLAAGTDGEQADGEQADAEQLVLLDVRTGRRTALAPGETRAGAVTVTADGRRVVFTSTASDLVPDDTNGTSDVFVRRVR
ncbi:TolB family protein [Streptomyces sp. NRRL B-1347]|uniref:TolB family protein n=1 Tax=Streptomyces sp. NRRL B-1347 TaxID=1476877 RepID=UPI0004CA7B59|nr:PD40 domain-containing protein [Streptomyces sp. NRRL B-1347]